MCALCLFVRASDVLLVGMAASAAAAQCIENTPAAVVAVVVLKSRFVCNKSACSACVCVCVLDKMAYTYETRTAQRTNNNSVFPSPGGGCLDNCNAIIPVERRADTIGNRFYFIYL